MGMEGSKVPLDQRERGAHNFTSLPWISKGSKTAYIYMHARGVNSCQHSWISKSTKESRDMSEQNRQKSKVLFEIIVCEKYTLLSSLEVK